MLKLNYYIFYLKLFPGETRHKKINSNIIKI